MFYTITWALVALLLALWSATAWALYTLAQWSGVMAGGVASAVAGLPDQWGMLQSAAWLAPWLPAGTQASWAAMLASLPPMFDYLLTLAPDLVAWLAPAIWLLWALGGLLLLVFGGALTLLVRASRRYRFVAAAGKA